MRTLSVELSTVKDKWHEIGIQLGIELSTLSAIEKQHPGIERQLSETLNFWLEGNTDQLVCWDTILAALKSPTVNKRGLAEELHKKYVECPLPAISDGECKATEFVVCIGIHLFMLLYKWVYTCT